MTWEVDEREIVADPDAIGGVLDRSSRCEDERWDGRATRVLDAESTRACGHGGDELRMRRNGDLVGDSGEGLRDHLGKGGSHLAPPEIPARGKVMLLCINDVGSKKMGQFVGSTGTKELKHGLFAVEATNNCVAVLNSLGEVVHDEVVAERFGADGNAKDAEAVGDFDEVIAIFSSARARCCFGSGVLLEGPLE